MARSEREITGTWEEIAARGAEFAGRKVKLTLLDRQPPTPSGQGKPIEEVIQEIMADVPEEEWDRLPPDLSDNLDHYMYGTPKK